MSAIDEGGKVAVTTVETLGKSHPLALALVLINLLFLGTGSYAIGQIGIVANDMAIRKDRLIGDLVSICVDDTSWTKRKPRVEADGERR
jgi:hypothetical protein